jgi:nicotinamidase-related amidase
VVDVQNAVVAKAHRRDEVIANINTLIDNARARQVPVIWVQHSDDGLPEESDGWQYVPELHRQGSEPLVHTYSSWQGAPGRRASVVETAAVDFDGNEQDTSS